MVKESVDERHTLIFTNSLKERVSSHLLCPICSAVRCLECGTAKHQRALRLIMLAFASALLQTNVVLKLIVLFTI